MRSRVDVRDLQASVALVVSSSRQSGAGSLTAPDGYVRRRLTLLPQLLATLEGIQREQRR